MKPPLGPESLAAPRETRRPRSRATLTGARAGQIAGRDDSIEWKELAQRGSRITNCVLLSLLRFAGVEGRDPLPKCRFRNPGSHWTSPAAW